MSKNIHFAFIRYNTKLPLCFHKICQKHPLCFHKVCQKNIQFASIRYVKKHPLCFHKVCQKTSSLLSKIENRIVLSRTSAKHVLFPICKRLFFPDIIAFSLIIPLFLILSSLIHIALVVKKITRGHCFSPHPLVLIKVAKVVHDFLGMTIISCLSISCDTNNKSLLFLFFCFNYYILHLCDLATS